MRSFDNRVGVVGVVRRGKVTLKRGFGVFCCLVFKCLVYYFPVAALDAFGSSEVIKRMLTG